MTTRTVTIPNPLGSGFTTVVIGDSEENHSLARGAYRIGGLVIGGGLLGVGLGTENVGGGVIVGAAILAITALALAVDLFKQGCCSQVCHSRNDYTGV